MRDLIGSVLVLVGGSLAVLFGSRQVCHNAVCCFRAIVYLTTLTCPSHGLQEANRTVEELEQLWAHTPFIVFASIQVFLLFILFAVTRVLSPEWRGFKHWFDYLVRHPQLKQFLILNLRI